MAEERNFSTTSGHRKSVAEEPVTSVLAPDEIPVFERELTADEEVLAALGYKYAQSPQISTMDAMLTHASDPSSSVNFPYGLPSVSPLPCSACYPRSPRRSSTAWATLAPPVWSGDG